MANEAAAVNSEGRGGGQDALQRLVAMTASVTGPDFFRCLVEELRDTLGTMGAWVARVDPTSDRLTTISMRMGHHWLDGFSYRAEGTPCERALAERTLVHIPECVGDLFSDPMLKKFGAVAYLGVPLFSSHGDIIGHLGVLDGKRMPRDEQALAVFQIIGHRAAAELERLMGEQALRAREAQLRSLLDGAMDAVLEFDGAFCLQLHNAAAARLFGCEEGLPELGDIRHLFDESTAKMLEISCASLAAKPELGGSLWLGEHLVGRRGAGQVFPAEATLSFYEAPAGAAYALILRDVSARVQAERERSALAEEASSLRSEIEALGDRGPILGSSPALLRAFSELNMVAETDATVLFVGETGTGKELFARALHERSPRRNRPFVRVNCGAIPPQLIESELFGHERGAFTGATQRREGRFGLAHGGTIFLDEIGELPLDLQPKLLRVLQEGEFEPVGSSRTQTVNVRVVAATHRDLPALVRERQFREDLYYRLAVVPIAIPPLRERASDVVELARIFLERACRKIGKRLDPLSPAVLERLQAHNWPGNVRELQNAIDRGVILARGSQFELEPAIGRPAPPRVRRSDESRIRTAAEIQELEAENLKRALEQSGGRVSGPEGAAALLGVPASTLSSRIKALGIARPRA